MGVDRWKMKPDRRTSTKSSSSEVGNTRIPLPREREVLDGVPDDSLRLRAGGSTDPWPVRARSWSEVTDFYDFLLRYKTRRLVALKVTARKYGLRPSEVYRLLQKRQP